eukprot:1151044-Ditylum_brightwellii.AAC.1
MDDKAWVKVVEVIAPSIWKLLVIRDHADWWINMFYDGFKSHVNIAEGLENFTAHHFRCLKEESASSYVNQTYDQTVASIDKKIQHHILDMMMASGRNLLKLLTYITTIVLCLKSG